MDKLLRTLLFSTVVVSLIAFSDAQNCSTYRFSSNTLFATCTPLSVLNSFLHWTYHPSNHTVDIAFRQTGVTTSQWSAWALNPSNRGMQGSQALVAFRNSSNLVSVYTAQVSRTTIVRGPLSFNVPNIRAEINNNVMVIYATLELPRGQTSFQQVWQNGNLQGDAPAGHPTSGANTRSVGRVDFLTGQSSDGGSVAGSRQRRRNVHGVLNVVSWGILLPLGVLIARYLRVFKSADPAWFYLHAACQSSAYIVGVAGWATGIKLGADSPGTPSSVHRSIGITLFCLGTLQVFALLLRPKKEHKFRFYWNIYHHVIGYSVIILSIINIFEGFDILDPERKWKRAYIGILIFLGANAVLLEAFTWFIVIRRKKTGSDKSPHVGNGANGANGHGFGSQHRV